MTNMLEIIYYSKTTWLGIQVVFDTCSTFTCFFCRKFLKKKTGYSTSRMVASNFYSKKKTRNSWTFFMIYENISFSILHKFPTLKPLPSCGQTGQAHVSFSPFSALCSFREQHQALPGEVVWRQPS